MVSEEEVEVASYTPPHPQLWMPCGRNLAGKMLT